MKECDDNSCDRKNDVESRRVSEWLDPDSKCGTTSYGNCVTNRGWCIADARRLNMKGLRAGAVNHRGKIAVFRLNNEETEKDVENALDETDEMKGGED